jgi:hypothetical protein
MRARHSCCRSLGVLALFGLPGLVSAQPVGSEFRVNTYTTGNQGTRTHGGHLIASDANGNFVVVWPGDGAGGHLGDIFGQRYDSAGDALGTEFRVNSFTPFGEPYASVAAGADGDFVVVWTAYNFEDGFNIFGQRYDGAGSALGSEFQISPSGGFDPPSVAAAADGAFVVVWTTSYSYQNKLDIFGRRFNSAGEAVGNEFRVNSYTTDRQYFPSLASDASGNFVVVWLSYGEDGSSAGIFGQRYDSGGLPQGGEFRVNTYTTGWQANPSVSSDPSGNFVVVWLGVDLGYCCAVFGKRYDSAGNALGGAFRVNSVTAGGQFSPSVASDASGNFVVVWSKGYSGPTNDIFGQRYDSAGVAQGGEFQVNSYTPSDQTYPSVWSTGTNEFVVVWQSSFQDGSSVGVFGQRFDFGSGSLTLHVGDLDGRAKNVGAGWRAQVTTFVHDEGHRPLSGALVTIAVAGGGRRSCTTTAAGRCEVIFPASDSAPSKTFTVTSLSKVGVGYVPAANHDPDPDSDGTVIVVNQP